MPKIGILALQGAFIEHETVLRRLKVETVQVRLPKDLEGIDGLIIPGGESTTIGRLMVEYGLMEKIKEIGQDGLPIMGTCAGAILMAKSAMGLHQESLGIMDIAVKRNAFGRQVDSFEADLTIPALGDNPFHAIFIRAPIIERTGPGVEVLAHLNNGLSVAARQKNHLALVFHPELTRDLRFHSYFIDIILGRKNGAVLN